MQSVAVAAFGIVSWNKDVIVELVLIFPLPIILIPQISNTSHQVPILHLVENTAHLCRCNIITEKVRFVKSSAQWLIVSSVSVLATVVFLTVLF